MVRSKKRGHQGRRVRHTKIAESGLSSHKLVPPEGSGLAIPSCAGYGYNEGAAGIAAAESAGRRKNQFFGAVASIAVRQYDTDNRRLRTAVYSLRVSRYFTVSARVALRFSIYPVSAVSTESRGAGVTNEMRRLSGPWHGKCGNRLEQLRTGGASFAFKMGEGRRDSPGV